jgi:hypothetical protein
MEAIEFPDDADELCDKIQEMDETEKTRDPSRQDSKSESPPYPAEETHRLE